MLFTSSEVKRIAIEMQNDPYLNNCGDEEHPKHCFDKNELKIVDKIISEIAPEVHKMWRSDDRPEYEFVKYCRNKSLEVEDPLTKRAYLWLGFAAKNICQAKISVLQAAADL